MHVYENGKRYVKKSFTIKWTVQVVINNTARLKKLRHVKLEDFKYL